MRKLVHRPRRLRRTAALRNLVRETSLSPHDFILPLFVNEKISARRAISSMSIADLASLASSVAVVVSLVFLGLQIRQSNRNQRSLMQQGRSARNVELLSRLSNPSVSDVISRAATGESLSDQDCFVLYGYMG